MSFRPRRDPSIYQRYATEAESEVRKTGSHVAHIGLAPDRVAFATAGDIAAILIDNAIPAAAVALGAR